MLMTVWEAGSQTKVFLLSLKVNLEADDIQ